ncbi:MAG: spermidine synthase [Candidatus Brocadiae bacterium]|nr:spermidine synthase [Candidatus Brocadiia bacterium]
MTVFLCLVFFLSGASALLFESIWFQLAGITFGNSVWAAALILSSFMAGLALGNALAAFLGKKIQYPLRFYAVLEATIAISGFSLVLIFPHITKIFVPFFQLFLSDPWILNALRAISAVILMLIPATAMGATLPVLVKALHKESPNFGKILGILYGWNTLGATAGVLAGEILFVPWLGLKGTACFAAALNILSGGMVYCLHLQKKLRYEPEKESGNKKQENSISFLALRFCIAGFICGFILLALEVIWFRFIGLFSQARSWDFSVMLSVVLAGISIGGLAASWLFSIKQDAQKLLPFILFSNAIFVVVLYASFSTVVGIFILYPFKVSVAFFSLFLMFPVSFCSGMAFTMLGKALYSEIQAETKATGLLTLANTLGAALGSLCAGLWLIPNLGVEKSFFLLSLFYGILGLLLCQKKDFSLKQIPASTTLATMACLIFLFSLVLFPWGIMENHYLHYPIHRFLEKGEKKIASREGITETIQYLQKDILGSPYYHRLVTNDYMMSGTDLKSKRYTKLFSYLPVALHPDPKNALLICFGCGSTAKAMTDTLAFEHIDMVDISQDIVELSHILYPKGHPAKDSRVQMHIEDGRFFLLSATKKYDLITAEPPPPKCHGIVNLYTKEYFKLIYNCLQEGGMVTYWLPVFLLEVEESKSILKAFHEVFPNASLWTGAGFQWMMLGIKEPQQKASYQNFQKQWDDPHVGEELKALGFGKPEDMLSLFIADGKRLQEWIQNSQPLEDNYPRRLTSEQPKEDNSLHEYLEFMNPRLSWEAFKKSPQNIYPKNLESYFLARETLTEILEKEKKPVALFHRAKKNPSLKNSLLWVFNSDFYAQKILSESIPIKEANSQEIWNHLLAQAALENDYARANKILELAEKNAIAHYGKEIYYQFRIYFAFLEKDIPKAKNLAQKYVSLCTEQDKAEESMDIYWNWVCRALEGSG